MCTPRALRNDTFRVAWGAQWLGFRLWACQWLSSLNFTAKYQPPLFRRLRIDPIVEGYLLILVPLCSFNPFLLQTHSYFLQHYIQFASSHITHTICRLRSPYSSTISFNTASKRAGRRIHTHCTQSAGSDHHKTSRIHSAYLQEAPVASLQVYPSSNTTVLPVTSNTNTTTSWVAVPKNSAKLSRRLRRDSQWHILATRGTTMSGQRVDPSQRKTSGLVRSSVSSAPWTSRIPPSSRRSGDGTCVVTSTRSTRRLTPS